MAFARKLVRKSSTLAMARLICDHPNREHVYRGMDRQMKSAQAGTPKSSARRLPAPRRLADVRALIEDLPGPDAATRARAEKREATLTKPQGALGRLEALSAWLASWQGRHPPRIERATACVFAANHGVAALGVSAYPPQVTRQMVANFERGGAAVNALCRTFGVTLRIDAL
jgi:nicotinate-nucleotide--dimethylbenzimidazole phosphoribosyltransferase